MIRRIARELVLQSLFQIDFAQVDCEAALNAAVEERSDKSAEKAKEYAQDVLNGVLANSEAIDARISVLLTGPWSVCRLSTVIFCGSPFMKCFLQQKSWCLMWQSTKLWK